MMIANETTIPNDSQTIKSLKKEIKDWEYEFASLQGRKPTKADIHQNKDIAKKYKLYAKLKTTLETVVETKAQESINVNEFISIEKRQELFPSSSSSPIKVNLSRNEQLNATNSETTVFGSFEALNNSPVKTFQPQQFKVKKIPIIQAPRATGNFQEISENIKKFTFGDKVFKENTSLSHEQGNQSGHVDEIEDCPEVDAFLNRKIEISQITQEQQDNKISFPSNTSVEQKIHKSTSNPLEIQTIVLPAEKIQASPGSKPAFVNKEDFLYNREEDVDDENDVSIEQDKSSIKKSVKPSDVSEDAVINSKSKESNETSIINAFDSGLGLKVKGTPLVQPKLFSRIPQDGSILRCKIIRKRNLIDKAYPTFLLYNEADNTFLLAARRRKKTKSLTYLISTSSDDLTKDSRHYVAKIKANNSRTNFILFDARRYKESAVDKGLNEIGCISYTKTILPRELCVAIPALDIDLETTESFTKDILADVKSHKEKTLQFLKNKKPRWNEATQSHCLNFGGRVTQPSIKNFQLVREDSADETLAMQFGRCGPDFFTMDVRYPMTPLQAFSVALTTFEAYDHA